MSPIHTRWFYLSLACVSLCMGYMVYFVGRPGPTILAIPASIDAWISVQPLVAGFSGQLPSFLHTYAFILLTFTVIGATSRIHLNLSIAIWLCIEILFEVGLQNLLFRVLIFLKKLRIELTGNEDLFVVQIDELSGCRCGNSADSCPP